MLIALYTPLTVALASGTRFGPYEILAPLGAGGMGEVYRALDTRLDRAVAIKVLPPHLTDNAEARQRFDREARAISSLNHANICALYDVGHQDGVDFLVMELLEGETLADRLAKGPLPTDQVFRYSIEICDGLERAHRGGVVHRDLKPANIMLTKSGAKLMDFGLAKAMAVPGPQSGAPAFSAVTMMASPDSPLTVAGTVAGTVQYMSPEQIQGLPADSRSDIFALGAVLYEMITAQRPFQGKSQLSVASAILERDPEPISTVKPLTHPGLVHVIARCLAKDPDERWQSISDVKGELQWVRDSGSQAGLPAMVTAQRKGRERSWKSAAIAAGALALLFAVALGWYFSRPTQPPQVVRALIAPPLGVAFFGAPDEALSPDGSKLAFVGTSNAGTTSLWVRPINSLTAQELTGTQGGDYPFWSPDSRSIGFFANSKLKKIDASGGIITTLCDAADGRGATWNQQGVILFAPDHYGGLFQVPEDGGTPAAVWNTGTSPFASDRFPWFLPDGKSFLFYYADPNLDLPLSKTPADKTSGIYAMRMGDKKPTLLVQGDTNAIYAQGFVLYIREDHLLAQKFDAPRLQLVGQPVPIADKVQSSPARQVGAFAVSQNGLLAYVADSAVATTTLDLFDRTGKKLATVAPPAPYHDPRISPNGDRVVFALSGPTQSTATDIWVRDIKRGTLSRLTFSNDALLPTWSHDGQQIAYFCDHGICVKNASGLGKETLLPGTQVFNYPEDWSKDGSELLYVYPVNAVPHDFVYSFKDQKSRQLLTDKPQVIDAAARFSPDGQWIAFQSYDTGRPEIYVMPYPGLSGKYQVSVNGGLQAVWRRDGKELFFVDPQGTLMSVEIKSFAPFTAGAPVPLFKTRILQIEQAFPEYDVTADGKQFLLNSKPETATQNSPMVLVTHWQAELKK